MKENDLREFIFKNYKAGINKILNDKSCGSASGFGDRFPTISEILRARTEQRIQKYLDQLEELVLDGQEVRLVRDGDSTTRIDLLGHFEEDGGLVIIELKKSDQTERQAFTELLAYANHFCTIFPSLSESSLSSILIAPMEGRGVRDAFAQELIVNDKNILALIPDLSGNKITLSPYRPSEAYYRWIENSILDDDAVTVVCATFPILDGWIDAGSIGDTSPPYYTRKAFEIMTANIGQKLEAAGLHGFVFARQYWNEVAGVFPNPNAIIVCVLNPYCLAQGGLHDGEVYGNVNESRLDALQGLVNQLEEKEFWLDGLQSSFQGQIIRIVQESFEQFFRQKNGVSVWPDISLPSWRGFKESMIESVICHNMSIRLTGLVRIIFDEYMSHCYAAEFDEIYYSDDLPMYGYRTYENFLAVWEIVNGLAGQGSEEPC